MSHFGVHYLAQEIEFQYSHSTSFSKKKNCPDVNNKTSCAITY